MASFNGSNIFGTAVSIAVAINPVRRQENPFPGVNGVQSLPMGQEGGVSTATGLLFGSNPGNLAAAEAAFRVFYDGLPYILVDTLGTPWNNVVLESFEPQGRISQSPFGFYFRKYTAKFRHLTNS